MALVLDTASEGVVQPERVAETLVAPTVRVFTKWTPARIEYAKSRAEAGDLSQLVCLCDWILTDDTVRAALGARIDAVLSLDVSFEPANGKPAEGDAASVDPLIEAVERDWPLAYPENELALIQMWGLVLGVAPFRHETLIDPITSRLLPNPKFWHPGTLSQDPRTEVWTVRDIDGAQHIVDAGDGEWGLHCPYGTRRPWAQGMVQTLADLILIKAFAWQDWSRASEKSSLLVAEMPLDKDGNVPSAYDQKVDVVGKLATRGGDASVAMPPGWVTKLLQVADSYQIFSEQITMINDAIARVIRGGNLTTQTSGGSKAAAQTQADTGDAPKRKADAKTLSTTMRQQSLVWWGAWNFGESANVPWPLWSSPEAVPEVNYFSFANGLSTFSDMGFELDADVLKSDYGLTFINGYDPAKAKPKAPPTFGVNPGATDQQVQQQVADAGAGNDGKGGADVGGNNGSAG